MVYPVAAAAGPGGTLLVLDQLRHKILAFDGQHEFLSEYGSIGDTPGAFYYPASMATDGNGHLYVAQSFRSLVQVFNVQADGAAE
jgi:DNA-binding beta-propeller fold protein YncE